ncbi:MAG: sugar phosphate isomerase/epimerase family protein [Candidatus Limivivens sp.]|nr:sugar phosphate isomerase/epimerase family protein [Candidatus Limivivens sp.]
MKLGVRAHDYGKRQIEEMAALLREEGYEAAQLVLPKAFTGIDSYQDITLKHLEQIRRVFEMYQIDIPVFGCYMDLGNPDPEVREYAVSNYKRCLTYAKEVGARVVGTETAYPHLTAEEKKRWHPFMMESVKRIVEEAQRIDMRAAIEPVYWHPLTDLETTLEVLRAADDPEHLRLIFDASNLLEFPESTDQNSYWKEWLDAVGSFIDVLHIKDFSLSENREYQPKVLGAGVIRYEAISRWLHEQNRELYLIREEMDPCFAREDLAFMRKL